MNKFLEHLPICHICLNPLDMLTNRILPCQHTYCEDCLNKCVQKTGFLRCPECRLRVPKKVKELPHNLTVNRLLESLSNLDPTTNVNNSPKIITYHQALDPSARSSTSSTGSYLRNSISPICRFSGSSVSRASTCSFKSNDSGRSSPGSDSSGISFPLESPPPPKATREFPEKAHLTLGAKNLRTELSLNLVDWSKTDRLAAAMGRSVHLWNSKKLKTEKLCKLSGEDYISSVAWKMNEPILAVGTSTGSVELYDCNQMKKILTLSAHPARVGSMSWNSNILSTGCRSGQIIQHDSRCSSGDRISSFSAHRGDICNMKWSTNGKYLASGGTDNSLKIWSMARGQNFASIQQNYSLNQHKGLVKALAWCPWFPNILASGSNDDDGNIIFWDITNGEILYTMESNMPVTSLVWSSKYKEIISSYGCKPYSIEMHKYPSMEKVASVRRHKDRVLHLALSPNESTLLTVSADQALKFWKHF